jgi:hypothetical protein
LEITGRRIDMREINYRTKPLADGDRDGESAARGRTALRSLAAITVLTTALAAVGCFESKVITSKVNPVSPGSSSSKDMNGVFYALPRTVVKADVPVNRTNKQPGALSVYTPCFFPGESYGVKKGSEFAIDTNNIKFDTMFIPDTEEVYMIKTKGGKFETKNLELTLTESGVLVKASAEVTNDKIDIVTGTVKTGAGLLAKALPVFLSEATGDLTDEQKQCRVRSVADWVEELDLIASGIVQYDADGKPISINEGMLTADKRFPETLRNKLVFKDGYDQAQKIFNQINQLSLRRTNILSTQPSNTAQVATVNADSIKLVLEEVDKSIEALKKNYFFGSEATLTWNASFRLNPSNPSKLSIDLFKLSKEYGVCQVLVNQGSSTRLDPRFLIKKRCRDGASTCQPTQMEPVACNGQLVRLDMALGEDGEGGTGGTLLANKIKSAGLTQNGNRGFYYRVPGRAVAFIKQAQTEGPEKELARAPLSIAQFGEVVSLPASTGGRRTKYTLELFESSGGLKNFVMGSSSLIQQKNIDDLAGAASTLIEAKGERNKAKAPPDELQQLERQRKILEEKKKIRELENELDGNENESGGEQTP